MDRRPMRGAGMARCEPHARGDRSDVRIVLGCRLLLSLRLWGGHGRVSVSRPTCCRPVVIGRRRAPAPWVAGWRGGAAFPASVWLLFSLPGRVGCFFSSVGFSCVLPGLKGVWGGGGCGLRGSG